jgi:hypothetical protein
LAKRKDDKFCKANKDKASNKEGIYINYNLSNDKDYAALAMNNSEMKIGIKDSGGNFIDKIKDDLTKLGLKSNQHFTIEKVD